MATLWKRANKSQRRIYSAVRGAVLNVFDAHELPRDDIFAKSVAKRATGTLLSQGGALGRDKRSLVNPSQNEPNGHLGFRSDLSGANKVDARARDGGVQRYGHTLLGRNRGRGSELPKVRVPNLIEKAAGSLSVRMWKLKSDSDKYNKGIEVLRLLARARELAETMDT